MNTPNITLRCCNTLIVSVHFVSYQFWYQFIEYDLLNCAKSPRAAIHHDNVWKEDIRYHQNKSGALLTIQEKLGLPAIARAVLERSFKVRSLTFLPLPRVVAGSDLSKYKNKISRPIPFSPSSLLHPIQLFPFFLARLNFPTCWHSSLLLNRSIVKFLLCLLASSFDPFSCSSRCSMPENNNTMSSSTALLPNKNKKKKDHASSPLSTLPSNPANSHQPIFMRICHSSWDCIGQKPLVTLRMLIASYLFASFVSNINYDLYTLKLGWFTVFKLTNIAYLMLVIFHGLAAVRLALPLCCGSANSLIDLGVHASPLPSPRQSTSIFRHSSPKVPVSTSPKLRHQKSGLVQHFLLLCSCLHSRRRLHLLGRLVPQEEDHNSRYVDCKPDMLR